MSKTAIKLGSRVRFTTPWGREGDGSVETIRETTRGVWYGIRERSGDLTFVRASGVLR